MRRERQEEWVNLQPHVHLRQRVILQAARAGGQQWGVGSGTGDTCVHVEAHNPTANEAGQGNNGVDDAKVCPGFSTATRGPRPACTVN